MTLPVDAPFPYRDDLGEGPTWDPVDRTLVRVDYLGHAVHRLDIQTGKQSTIILPEPVGFGLPTKSGHFVVGQRTSVHLVNPDGDFVRVLAELNVASPALRINDGKADPTGALVFGTISETRTPNATCYRLGKRLDTQFEDVVISNGMAWDTERSRFYYVDSWTGRIDVCDFDPADGSIRNRRPFAEVPAQDGGPDGICLDEEGCVWAPLFGGGTVRRFRPDGGHDMDISLPVTHPTSVAFGGDDLRTLFITTSRHRLSDSERAEQPLAGAVLTATPGIAGRREFALSFN